MVEFFIVWPAQIDTPIYEPYIHPPKTCNEVLLSIPCLQVYDEHFSERPMPLDQDLTHTSHICRTLIATTWSESFYSGPYYHCYYLIAF